MRTVDLHSHGWFQYYHAGPDKYSSVLKGIVDACMDVSLDVTTYTEVLGSPFQRLKEAAGSLDGEYEADDMGIALRVRRHGKEVMILKSQEVHTRTGHILVIGSEATFPDKRPLAESLQRAKGGLSIIVAPHPLVISAGIGKRNLVEFAEDFDAIEVFNAQAARLGPGRYLDMYRTNARARKIASQLGRPGIAASDAHSPRAIGSSYIIMDFPLKFRTAKGLLKALKENIANNSFTRKEQLSGRRELAKWAGQHVYHSLRSMFSLR